MTDAASALPVLLRPTERVLWSGRPDPRVLFTRADLFLVPFSTFFLGFSIFWTVSALSSANAPAFFPVVGAVFVAIGLYVFAGRFAFKAWSKSQTTYFVTDARVLSVTRGSVREASVTTDPVQWRQSRDHLTVTFGVLPGSLGISLDNTGWINPNAAVGAVSFFDVADGAAMRAAIEGGRV